MSNSEPLICPSSRKSKSIKPNGNSLAPILSFRTIRFRYAFKLCLRLLLLVVFDPFTSWRTP